MSIPPSSAPAAAPKKRSCLFYGCLTLLILGVILGIGVGAGLWYVSKTLRSVVEQYTDTKPLAITATEMTEADYARLDKRVAAFGEALRSGKAADALSLSADELNALLARSPALSMWKDSIQVRLEGDQVRARVSLPLDQFGQHLLFRSLRGRYLNGEAAMDVGMVGGRLDVRLQALQVKGQSLPAEVLQAFKQQNLAEAAYEDPAKLPMLQKLKSVQVQDGRIVVQARE